MAVLRFRPRTIAGRGVERTSNRLGRYVVLTEKIYLCVQPSWFSCVIDLSFTFLSIPITYGYFLPENLAKTHINKNSNPNILNRIHSNEDHPSTAWAGHPPSSSV